MNARTGDWLVVEPLHVGGGRRVGLIVDVRGEHGEPPFMVRWNDTGHETLVFPGSGAHVVPPEAIDDFLGITGPEHHRRS